MYCILLGLGRGREDELSSRLGYTMVRTDNWQNTFTGGEIEDMRVLGTRCSTGIDWIEDKLTRMGVELELTQWFWIDEKNIENCSKNCS